MFSIRFIRKLNCYPKRVIRVELDFEFEIVNKHVSHTNELFA